MFGGIWKSSLDAPALSLHSASNLNPASQELPQPNHQPAYPPSNVISPTSVELPGRKGNTSKGTQQFSSQNCLPQVTVEKDLFPQPYQDLNIVRQSQKNILTSFSSSSRVFIGLCFLLHRDPGFAR
ncbi:hypothetical protein XENORESO_010912 [Xenotaenia resolanae]|uniref:Uncharacterized protein n=1 Tax=Xenotaenia resolanae TaxID=208358 RepID=A0ABV0WQL1_9TELE